MSELIAQPNIPEPKRILIVGAEPTIEDFVGWYLLKLIHEKQGVVSVFAETSQEIPDGILDEQFDAIFLLNHVYDVNSRYLGFTKVVFDIGNCVYRWDENDTAEKPYWLFSEFSHRVVFAEGSQEWSRFIQTTDSRSGPHRRSLSSPILQALTFHRLGQWWSRPESVVDTPVLSISLAGVGETRYNNLRATLQMLDALPAYADRGMARLHEKLELLWVDPKMDIALKPEAGYKVLDEFFQQESLL